MHVETLATSFGAGLLYLLLIGGGLALILPGRLQPEAARRLGMGPHVEALLLISLLTGVQQLGLGNVPVWIDQNGVVAFSLVGAVVPSILSLHFLWRAGPPRFVAGLVGVAIVAAVSWMVSRPEPEMGIVSEFPWFTLPSLAAAAWAFLLSPLRLGMVPLAYAIATLGTLTGADLLRFEWVLRTQKPVAGSFGGAEIFDLVFLAGLWAAGMAALPLGHYWSRLNRGTPAWGPVVALHAQGRLVEALQAGTRIVVDALPGWAQRHAVQPVDPRELRRLAAAEPVLAQVEEAVRLGEYLTPDKSAPILENLEGLHRRLQRPRIPTTAPRTERFAAFVLDALVPLGGAVALVLLVAPMDPGTAPLVFFGLSAFITLHILYPFLSESLFHGATLGKAMFKLRVRRLDGSPARTWDLFVRNIARLLDLPMLYLVGALASSDFGRQRLGDYFAATAVCKSDDVAMSNAVQASPNATPAQATQGTQSISRAPR